jgi:hypothetical protein
MGAGGTGKTFICMGFKVVKIFSSGDERAKDLSDMSTTNIK